MRGNHCAKCECNNLNCFARLDFNENAIGRVKRCLTIVISVNEKPSIIDMYGIYLKMFVEEIVVLGLLLKNESNGFV